MNVVLEDLIREVKALKPLFFNRDMVDHVTEKGVSDFVTQVDLTVERTIKEALHARYPEAVFLAEESAHGAVDFQAPLFILDPVDGTTNLIHGYQQSSVSLAYAEGGELLLGIVYNPFTEELFSAEKGKGARLNGEVIRVSAVKELKDALVEIGTTPYNHEIAEQVFDLAREIYLHTSDIRRGGSAALDMCYTACGRVDAYLEALVNPWDVSAGMLIVAEAGGRCLTFDGTPHLFSKKSSIVASNGYIGELIVEEIIKKDERFLL